MRALLLALLLLAAPAWGAPLEAAYPAEGGTGGGGAVTVELPDELPADADVNNAFAAERISGEHTSTVTGSAHQVFTFGWQWSRSGTGESSGANKTQHGSREIHYVKQARAQGGGAESLNVYGPGPGDNIARTIQIHAPGVSDSSGDEGAKAMRLEVQNYDQVPRGTTSSATTAGVSTSVDLSLALSNMQRAIGEENLLIYTEKAQTNPETAGSNEVEVNIASYDSGDCVLTTDPDELDGLGITNGGGSWTGWVYADEGTQYDSNDQDAASGGNHWEDDAYDFVQIIAGPGDSGCGGTCGDDEFETRVVHHGANRCVPASDYLPNGGTPGGAGIVARAERITDFDPTTEADGARPIGTSATVTIETARHTIGSSAVFQIQTGGPPHQLTGVSVRYRMTRGFSVNSGPINVSLQGGSDSRRATFGFRLGAVGAVPSGRQHYAVQAYWNEAVAETGFRHDYRENNADAGAALSFDMHATNFNQSGAEGEANVVCSQDDEDACLKFDSDSDRPWLFTDKDGNEQTAQTIQTLSSWSWIDNTDPSNECIRLDVFGVPFACTLGGDQGGAQWMPYSFSAAPDARLLCQTVHNTAGSKGVAGDDTLDLCIREGDTTASSSANTAICVQDTADTSADQQVTLVSSWGTLTNAAGIVGVHINQGTGVDTNDDTTAVYGSCVVELRSN